MSEEIKYRFYTEIYPDETSVETLRTGDGKTQFTDLKFDDGTVGIGTSYRFMNAGIGWITRYEHGTVSTDEGVKWQIIFDNEASIDAMIAALKIAKAKL